MKKFSQEKGPLVAVIEKRQPLNFIFPMAFIQQVGDKGYQEFAFYQNKYLPGLPRRRRPDSIMNQLEDGLIEADFLLVGPAFGLDDKKESGLATLVALRALGIRALIGVQFGPHFKDTALKRGILVIELDLEDWQKLAGWHKSQDKTNPEIEINLPMQELTFGLVGLSFAVDSLVKEQYLKGEDEIAYSLNYLEEIQAYEAKQPY